MSNGVILLLLAVVGGIAVTLQAHFMGLIDQAMGSRESVFITYVSGGMIIGIVLLFFRGGNLHMWRTVPWFAFTSGIIGLFIVGTIGYIVPRLGLVTTFTILVATQFISGALFDHFGLLAGEIHMLTPTRVMGLGALLAGVWLVTQ